MVLNATARLVIVSVGKFDYGMTTSLRSFVAMSSVCASMNIVQGSTNAFDSCLRLWSSVFQGLHSSGRHFYPVKPPFGSSGVSCTMDQNLIVGAFKLQHQSSEMLFLSPLNIHHVHCCAVFQIQVFEIHI